MAKKAATLGELEELHRLVTRSYTDRIQQDLEDKLPTDAATLAGAAKFLKDNNITADPADKDDLDAMREVLAKQAQARRQRGAAVLQLAKSED
jgi:uncharacterized protein YaaQ